MKKIFLGILVLNSIGCFGQWETSGLNNGFLGNTLGTYTAHPINIFTNTINTAQFSTGNSLSSPWDVSGPFNPTGDGLRINPVSTGSGFLDMFTGSQGTTHIKWGTSGAISGQNSRFEQYASGTGFFFNTVSSGYFKFAHSGLVNCFVGTNNFWRIGIQGDATNLSAVRRLEVVDGTWQFRLTNGSVYTDFLTNSNGNLQIKPSPALGKVGINANEDPTATIDVFGDARIRDVQEEIPDALFVGVQESAPNDLKVRRLDFTGNPNQVLLGNGTWGIMPTVPPAGPILTANNGVSRLGNVVRLGDQYLAAGLGVTNTPLTTNRQVRLGGNNFVFSGAGNVGIGLSFPVLPTQKLDVDGNARFRTLPNGVNQANAAVNKVVMVDADGVLRWKDLATIGTLNNAVNGAWINTSNALEWGTNPLIHNTEVPMADFNVSFSCLPNAPSNTNNVKIGGNSTPVPIKLAVFNDVENIGALVISNSPVFGGTNRFGILGVSQNAYISIGVAGNSSNGVRTIGVNGIGNNGINASIGVQGKGSSTLGQGNAYGGLFSANSNTPFENYGVNGFATGSPKTNFGGYFTSLGGSLAIGVYGEANSSDPGALVYAGYFAGEVVSGVGAVPSDVQFKTNINGIQDANSVLEALNPVTYNYIQSGNASYLHFPNNMQYGLIAQEVEIILPDLVSSVSHPEQHDSLGNITVPTFDYKTLKYELLIPILIQGHKEQNLRIDSLTNVNNSVTNNNDSLVQAISDLNARLTLLENCLSNILPALCNANQMAVQQTPEEVQQQLRAAINVNLSDRNSIVLNQNVPNPFAESTIITFTIPATVQKAQIHFYDGQGKLINSVDIIERGNGQLNVFANDLSTGVYTYSLVADGQIVSTKRMMKQ